MNTQREVKTSEMAARRRVLGVAVVGLATMAGVIGCASGRALESGPATGWLDATGFPEREGWPSRLLHLDRRRLPPVARLSSLVAQAPGVIVGPPRGAHWGVRRTLPDGSRCDVGVSLNGAQVQRKDVGGDWTIDFLVAPKDLDGVELHAGPEGPLSDDGGCGTLLLWSEAASAGAAPSFHGSIEGLFWGAREADVVEVVLEGSGQRADLTGRGNFVFREVLPGLRWVAVRTADATVGRDTVRVYAFTTSAVDIPVP